MLQSDPRAAAAAGSTPLEARAALAEVLDETQDLAGGTWTTRDDASPRSCAVQWGLSGDTYALLRISTAPTDSRVADGVQRTWERWGYTVARSEVGPVSQLVGTLSPTAEVMVFRVSERAMTLQGESACRPSE